MKALNVKELREKSIDQLQVMLLEERAQLFGVRRDLVFRKITDISSMKSRRHNIARIMTIVGEKQREVKA